MTLVVGLSFLNPMMGTGGNGLSLPGDDSATGSNEAEVSDLLRYGDSEGLSEIN